MALALLVTAAVMVLEDRQRREARQAESVVQHTLSQMQQDQLESKRLIQVLMWANRSNVALRGEMQRVRMRMRSANHSTRIEIADLYAQVRRERHKVAQAKRQEVQAAQQAEQALSAERDGRQADRADFERAMKRMQAERARLRRRQTRLRAGLDKIHSTLNEALNETDGDAPLGDDAVLSTIPAEEPSGDARGACLTDVSEQRTRAYLAAVYGRAAVQAALRSWDWRRVDVLWLDLLDDQMLGCINRYKRKDDADQGKLLWAAHGAVGFFLPPIGSKMEWPVVWQYHHENACAGNRTEMGGWRTTPYDDRTGSWVEVFHYARPRRYGSAEGELDHLWLYRARGSGLWVHTGRTLTFDDTIDLQRFLDNRASDGRGLGSDPRAGLTQAVKVRLIARAAKQLGGQYDTIGFRRHVDRGYSHSQRCESPKPGWDTIYSTLHELVRLAPRGQVTCPPLQSMRAGWPLQPDLQAPCTCDPWAYSARWPSLLKDARWQLGVVRCKHGDVTTNLSSKTKSLEVAQALSDKSGTTSASVLDGASPAAQLARRFGNEGIPVRIMEDSFPLHASGGYYPRPSLTVSISFDLGVHPPKHYAARRLIGSVLRWDLPFSIYAAGTWPSDYDNYEAMRNMGSLNTAAGWIFSSSVLSKMSGGWGHDSWTDTARIRCQGGRRHTKYATARYQQVWKDVCPSGKPIHGWTPPFGYIRDAQLGCFQQDWSKALEDQKAYAKLVAERKEGSAGACGVCLNYNQLHFREWSALDVEAIFYVNASLVASQGLPWFMDWGDHTTPARARQPPLECGIESDPRISTTPLNYSIRKCRSFKYSAEDRHRGTRLYLRQAGAYELRERWQGRLLTNLRSPSARKRGHTIHRWCSS